MAIRTDPAASPECRVDVSSYEGTAVVHLRGELVSGTTPGLRADLASVVGRRRVLLELSGVTLMDNSGLGAFLGAIRRIQEGRGMVALCGAKPPIAAVLRSAGVDHLVHVASSPAEAVAWVDATTSPPASAIVQL